MRRGGCSRAISNPSSWRTSPHPRVVVDDEALLRATTAAAVVLDMVMPGLRGGDVYLEVRAILDRGVGGWPAKPYDDRRLVATLEQVVRSRD